MNHKILAALAALLAASALAAPAQVTVRKTAGDTIGVDLVAIADAEGRPGDAFVVRRDHRQAWPAFAQTRHAAHMVVVVVGQQDRVRRRCVGQCVQHR